MQPACMRSVSFLGKFTSGSRISASRSDLLKLPIIRTTATTATIAIAGSTATIPVTRRALRDVS